MWYLSVLLFSLLATSSILAQVASLTSIPYDGQLDVSPSASIRVRAPSPIHASSLDRALPRSSKAGRHREPTVLVIRKGESEKLDRHEWIKRCIVGDVRQLDDYTMEWKPRRLLPGTTYRCIVQGIVVESAQGPEELPPLDLEFTTARHVPRLGASTLDTHQVVSCSSIVWLPFTAPVDDDVSMYDLIEVEQQRSDGTWGPAPRYQIQRVTRSLAAIGCTSGWSPGLTLRVNARLSRITGEVADDRRLEAMVRGAARLSVRSISTDGRAVPETLDSAAQRLCGVITPTTGLALVMPEYSDDRWRFLRWECSKIPQVHGSITPAVQSPVDCAALQPEIEARAVYEFVDTIAVTISADTLGVVVVSDQDGREIAVVEDTATLMVDTTITRLFLSARPLTGGTFAAWTSNISGCQASTAPSLTVPVTALVHSAVNPGTSVQGSPVGGYTGNQPHVYINPRFIKLTPVAGDRYRLVARIANSQPEEGYSIADHVLFTTPSEFEETHRTTRTVCVLAEDCWEIIGYHDAATGPPVWFDKGRKDLCVDAELLDPENTLVFFGRRVPIDVRIERVLLSKDSDDDVITGRAPHSETRIDVDKLVTINGVERWIPLSTSICMMNGISTQRAGLRCGDKIRLIVRAATQRGEQWRWWTARDRYALPRGTDPVDNAPVYTLKIDESVARFDATSCDGQMLGHREVAIRAAFRKRFVIDAVSFRVRTHQGGERWKYRFEERWYDPLLYYDIDRDEPRGGRQIEYIARRGTTIKLRFSRPLDVPSAYAGTISAECTANILHTDPQARDLDFTAVSSEQGNTLVQSSSGQYLDIVEFAVYQPGTKPIKQALHAGMIDLLCSTGLRSIDGEPLETMKIFAVRRMELPGFGLRVTDAKFAYDGDTDYFFWEDHGEMYHALYGMNTSSYSPVVNADGFVRYPDCRQQRIPDGDCTRECGDEGDNFSFGDREIWLQTAWMDWGDLAFARIGSWDEDCQDNDRCLVNNLRDVLGELQKRSDLYKGDSLGSTKEDVIYDIISLGSNLISALLPVAEQDDHLAEVTYLESATSLWGMSTPTAPRIFLSEENADYSLRGQWYVSRAVVR